MRKIILSSVVGTVLFPLILLCPVIGGFWKSVLGILLPELVMLQLAFSFQTKEMICKAFVCMTGYELLLGGSITAFSQLFPHWFSERTSVVLIWVLGSAAFLSGLLFLKSRQRRGGMDKCIYQVEMDIYGSKIQVTGFADSGNHLIEPCSQRPVVILERDMIRDLLEKVPLEKKFVIPFHSIGKRHGLMEALEIPDMWVAKGKEKQHFEKVVAALSEEILSSSHTFQLILHPKFLTYWEE